MYLLNGALFDLVGLEAQAAVRGLSGTALTGAAVMVVAVAGVLVVVRFLFLSVSVYTIRAVDRRPRQRVRRMGHRARVISALAGFRGAVSLALALSVPSRSIAARRSPTATRSSSSPPVSLSPTLVLPAVARWARLPGTRTPSKSLHLSAVHAASAVSEPESEPLLRRWRL